MIRINTLLVRRYHLSLYIPALLVFCYCSAPGSAQQTLPKQLEGKNTFSEIMKVVDQYYNDHPENEDEEFESEYLQWNRWEWCMSGRLGPNGEFVNIPDLLMKGTAEKENGVSQTDRNINSGWTFMGPVTSPLQNSTVLFTGIGRADKITFHPTNVNIIYICTPNGGLWSTSNVGGGVISPIIFPVLALQVSYYFICQYNDLYLLTVMVTWLWWPAMDVNRLEY
jgi:hypothetical protein